MWNLCFGVFVIPTAIFVVLALIDLLMGMSEEAK